LSSASSMKPARVSITSCAKVNAPTVVSAEDEAVQRIDGGVLSTPKGCELTDSIRLPRRSASL